MDILLGFEHEASIVFDQAGTATVVIRGWAKPENEPFELERSITVQ